MPVSTAYNQWTQFEEFPKFMDGVESVTQVDDTNLRWVAKIGGAQREWNAEIVEQVPDQKIGWRATSGEGPNGDASSSSRSARTRRCITVEMSYEPEA